MFTGTLNQPMKKSSNASMELLRHRPVQNFEPRANEAQQPLSLHWMGKTSGVKMEEDVRIYHLWARRRLLPWTCCTTLLDGRENMTKTSILSIPMDVDYIYTFSLNIKEIQILVNNEGN